MAPERKYVTVEGKRYPLKTESERAASTASNSQPSKSSTDSDGNGTSLSVPAVHDAPRQVLLALVIAFLVFMAAGGKVEKIIAQVRGTTPPATDSKITAPTLFGWGFLLISLMVMADIRPMSNLAKAFAWLILLTVAMQFGPQALNNITALTGGKITPTTYTPPPTSRLGGHQG